MKKTLAAAVLVLAPCFALADTSIAVGAGAGTTGADLAVTYKLSDSFNLRGTLSGFDYKKNGQYGTDANFDGKFKLFQAGALVDYYPFQGSFRLSTGLVINDTKLSIDGKPSGNGSYTLNGNTYSASDVTGLNGSAKWNKPAFYLGIGLGNPVQARGLSVSADLGVMYTGHPSTDLSAQCGSSISAATCAQLQSDTAAERAKLQNDANKLNFWPVARVMANYAF